MNAYQLINTDYCFSLSDMTRKTQKWQHSEYKWADGNINIIYDIK